MLSQGITWVTREYRLRPRASAAIPLYQFRASIAISVDAVRRATVVGAGAEVERELLRDGEIRNGPGKASWSGDLHEERFMLTRLKE